MWLSNHHHVAWPRIVANWRTVGCITVTFPGSCSAIEYLWSVALYPSWSCSLKPLHLFETHKQGHLCPTSSRVSLARDQKGVLISAPSLPCVPVSPSERCPGPIQPARLLQPPARAIARGCPHHGCNHSRCAGMRATSKTGLELFRTPKPFRHTSSLQCQWACRH